MIREAYHPTDEQTAIIAHDGHAFVRACPGAGKTRTMVERARHLLATAVDRRGVAFLSFTNAAVEELEARLRNFGILPVPLFPSFIGTFDRFLWQFLVTPFGVEGCGRAPRLVPDKPEWGIRPYEGAHTLKLAHFDRATGALLADKVARTGFAPRHGAGAWETTARNTLKQAMSEGLLDFDDIRSCVGRRLTDPGFSARVGAALAGRFREIVVDEAQDCNPADLNVIDWLRASGVKIKVVCDPNQAIYGFRGGLTDELLKFAETFDPSDILPMSGNFRSSPAICAAISQLRPPISRGAVDIPLGRRRYETIPVHILAYGGKKVPAAVGARFQELVAAIGIPAAQAPILAKTWASAEGAVGRAIPDPGNDKSLLLAEAVMGFHASFDSGSRRKALERLHCAVLMVRGEIASVGSYSRHVSANSLDDGRWRHAIIAVGHALKPGQAEASESWLNRARTLLNWVRIFCDGRKLIDSGNLVSDGLSGSIVGG